MSVAQASGIMMGSLLLSRVLGLLRDTVMASQFGIGMDTDAYRLAVNIPDLLFMLIAGGGLSSAFIPVFSKFIHTDREEDAWRVFNVVVTVCAIVVIALIVLAWVLAPEIATFFAAGQKEALVPRIVTMGRIMLPAQFAFLIGSVILGTLYARNRFVAPGLAPNIYNVGIIAGALVGSAIGIGIAGMSWGALIGAMLGNLVLPSIIMLRLGGKFKPSLDIHAPGVSEFFKLLLPVIVGFSLPSVCATITQKFASMYPEGSNTVLMLSNNLMQAPLGIFGQSLALAAFPMLAKFHAQDRMDLYRSQVARTLRNVLFLGIPSCALMFALAPDMVRLIYGYGKGNDPAQLLRTAECLRLYCLGIPFWCAQPVLMRGFFALHKTAKPIILSTGITLLFILMCWGVERSSLGYLALPIATDVAAAILAVILWFTLVQDVGSMDLSGILKTSGLSLVASAAMGGIAYGASWLMKHALHLPPNPNRIPLAGIFVLSSLLGAWAFYYAARFFKMPEAETLDRAMAKLSGRLKPKRPAEDSA